MPSVLASQKPFLYLDQIPAFDSNVDARIMAERLAMLKLAIASVVNQRHVEADGLVWIEEHPALSNVDALIDALNDASNGKANSLLSPVKSNGGANLKASVRKRRLAILELVSVIELSDGISNAEARRRVAQLYAKTKTLVEHQKVTPELLKRWQDRLRKAQNTP